MADSTKGEFQEVKKTLCIQKVWVEKKSRCIMLYPRWLDVTWGFPPYWVWNCYKETSEDNIEVVKLMSVCWVNVRGQFKNRSPKKLPAEPSIFDKARNYTETVISDPKHNVDSLIINANYVQ